MSLNKWIGMGRICKDIEIKTTQSGTSVCNFTIAVDRRFTKQGEEKKTDFIVCIAWAKSAEFIQKYFHKGSMIAIVGRIETRSWDAQDGSKRYATEVIVEECSFAGEKKRDDGGTNETEIPGFSPVPGDDSELPF